MADKTNVVDLEQFKDRPNKGKALVESIEKHNEKVKADQEKRFHEDLNTLTSENVKRFTKNRKYFFIGR